jgi:hypothetical protein
MLQIIPLNTKDRGASMKSSSAVFDPGDGKSRTLLFWGMEKSSDGETDIRLFAIGGNMKEDFKNLF